MNVAHVNADPGVAPGKKKGATVHVEAMRKAFAALGQTVLAVDEPDESRLRASLEAEHATRGIDLVYERHALAAFGASEFARRHGVPYVIEVNSPLAQEASLYRDGTDTDVDPVREHAYFHGAERVLCVSHECAEYARARGARPERVVVEPNAVDPDLFRPRSDDTLRDQLVPRGELAVGFHGRLRPWHNFAMLVAALELLRAQGVGVHLLVLGEGPFEDELRSSVVREHATIVGWRPHEEAARVVACMDVLPLTYAPDKPCWYSPLKLLEAMAVGAVPVVPRLGDLTRAVEHDVDGLVYEAGDVQGLANAIARLVRDVDGRRRLAQNARRRAAARTWISIARDVLTCGRERRCA